MLEKTLNLYEHTAIVMRMRFIALQNFFSISFMPLMKWPLYRHKSNVKHEKIQITKKAQLA